MQLHLKTSKALLHVEQYLRNSPTPCAHVYLARIDNQKITDFICISAINYMQQEYQSFYHHSGVAKRYQNICEILFDGYVALSWETLTLDSIQKIKEMIRQGRAGEITIIKN